MKELYISRKALSEVESGETVVIHSVSSKGWKTEASLQLDENLDTG